MANIQNPGNYAYRIAELERRMEFVESASRRGEWEISIASSAPYPDIGPGQAWARANNSNPSSWLELVTSWEFNHIDAGGTNHPLWMIPDDGDPDGFNPDWLFGVEALDADAAIVGSAFYTITPGTAINTDRILKFSVDPLRFEGTPPQDDTTIRAIFTPLTAGVTGRSA